MNELFSQILTTLYNFTSMEYVLFAIISILLPTVYIILSFISPKKFTTKEVILSLFTLIAPILYVITLIVVTIISNQTYSFDFVFSFIYLMLTIWLTFIFGISNNKMSKYLIFSFSIVLLNLPLIYTGFLSVNSIIPYLTAFVITTLILSLQLRKYYAKL